MHPQSGLGVQELIHFCSFGRRVPVRAPLFSGPQSNAKDTCVLLTPLVQEGRLSEWGVGGCPIGDPCAPGGACLRIARSARTPHSDSSQRGCGFGSPKIDSNCAVRFCTRTGGGSG